MLRGGWAYVWGANETITVPGPNGIAGTSLYFSKTLGGDSTTDAFRVDAQWRFNEKHAAQFAWYRVAFRARIRSKSKLLLTVRQSAGVHEQEFGLQYGRAMYQYSFYCNDQVELAVVPGLYLAKTNFILGQWPDLRQR